MNLDGIEKFYKEKFEEKLKDNKNYSNAKNLVEKYANCITIECSFGSKYIKFDTDFIRTKLQLGEIGDGFLGKSFMLKQKSYINNCDKRKLKLQKKLAKVSDSRKGKTEQELVDIENDKNYSNAVKYLEEYNYFQQLFKSDKSCIEDAVKVMDECEQQVVNDVMFENLNSDASKSVINNILGNYDKGYQNVKYYIYARNFFAKQLNDMNKEEQKDRIKNMNEKISNYLNKVSSKNAEEAELN